MQVLISNKANENISNIFEYTSKISNKYANKVISNIYSTIDSLKYTPYIGRYVPEISNKYFRERIYKEFRIIYSISEANNIIYIRYIISGKQNLNLFFELHKKDLLNKFFL